MSDWWNQWTVYHAAVFGWGIDRQATYAAWRGIFAEQKATAEEMTEAVRRAAKSERPLVWPAENLAALQAALRTIRRERATNYVTADPDERRASPEEMRRFAQLMRGIGRNVDN